MQQKTLSKMVSVQTTIAYTCKHTYQCKYNWQTVGTQLKLLLQFTATVTCHKCVILLKFLFYSMQDFSSHSRFA